MRSKVTLLGHAVHPLLIVFPLGLLMTSTIFDAVYLSSGLGKWAELSYWLIAGGVLSGLVAAAIGFIDWLYIPSCTRAKTVGLWHGAGNVAAVVLLVLSLFFRRWESSQPGTLAISLSFLGIALAVLGGSIGGELVERLGVGVEEGAHLNAPSSLARRGARKASQPPV
jgi:uncharacterized membrane protein